jgi:hypothetical protein
MCGAVTSFAPFMLISKGTSSINLSTIVGEEQATVKEPELLVISAFKRRKCPSKAPSHEL